MIHPNATDRIQTRDSLGIASLWTAFSRLKFSRLAKNTLPHNGFLHNGLWEFRFQFSLCMAVRRLVQLRKPKPSISSVRPKSPNTFSIVSSDESSGKPPFTPAAISELRCSSNRNVLPMFDQSRSYHTIG